VALPSLVLAAENEIHYQQAGAIRGNTIEVTDSSPSGETKYRCKLDTGSCTKNSSTTKHLFPAINGFRGYPTSPLGRYGVTQQTLNLGGIMTTYYQFYDVRKSTPEFQGLVMVSGTVTKTFFSPDEWLWFYDQAGYEGDHGFIYFE